MLPKTCQERLWELSLRSPETRYYMDQHLKYGPPFAPETLLGLAEVLANTLEARTAQLYKVYSVGLPPTVIHMPPAVLHKREGHKDCGPECEVAETLDAYFAAEQFPMLWDLLKSWWKKLTRK